MLQQLKMNKLLFHIILAIVLVFGSCDKKDDSPSETITQQNNLPSDEDPNEGTENFCESVPYPSWTSSPYVLPYPVGKIYTVNLDHCSRSYHAPGQPDQYAIDFDMSIGEIITASREGIVVYIEETGFDGGFPNNLVIIQHEDGTFAQYMHLTNNGATVEKGEKVFKGDTIGLSGVTGLAGYPHLHFVVTKAGDFNYPYESIPYNFSNTIENPKGPQTGIAYEAFPY